MQSSVVKHPGVISCKLSSHAYPVSELSLSEELVSTTGNGRSGCDGNCGVVGVALPEEEEVNVTSAEVEIPWLPQWPFLEGRQSTHCLPDLTQEHDLQRPLPLHRQQLSSCYTTTKIMQLLLLAGLARALDAPRDHTKYIAIFWAERSSGLNALFYTVEHVKKEQRQVN